MALIGSSRSELLDWINTTFQQAYTKIEQCGTGAIYCVIFNSMYPETINMGRVNFQPNTDYQILTNYKLLQNGFNKMKFTREIPVDKLMKCRLQDNLEFLQWLSKLWCESNADYVQPISDTTKLSTSNITASRNIMGPTAPNRSVSGNSRRVSAINRAGTNLSGPTSSPSTARNRTHNSGTVNTSTSKIRSVSGSSISNNSVHNNNVNSSNNSAIVAKLKQELKISNNQLEESLKLQQGLETERNFYFNKLREIEILCQNVNEGIGSDINLHELISHIQDIMYSTEEGFQVPNEENGNRNIGLENQLTDQEQNLEKLQLNEELLAIDEVENGNGFNNHDLQIMDEETF